ncbi:MAG: nuclear transport factor 2 family protein [Thermoanaerobaculia bacterium]
MLNARRRPHRLALALVALVALVSSATVLRGATAAPSSAADEKTRTEITALLHDFLTPQVNGQRSGHERFWADDLVYTSSGAVVMSKADILKSFDEPPKAETGKAPEPEAVYSAEDILVRPYGDTAALTFRLVAKNPDGSVQFYRNSGTFLYRHGQWQAVTWQATKVPPKE